MVLLGLCGGMELLGWSFSVSVVGWVLCLVLLELCGGMDLLGWSSQLPVVGLGPLWPCPPTVRAPWAALLPLPPGSLWLWVKPRPGGGPDAQAPPPTPASAPPPAAGPINREMRHLISSLQNHNHQLKGDVQRYKRKLREVQAEINKVGGANGGAGHRRVWPL